MAKETLNHYPNELGIPEGSDRQSFILKNKQEAFFFSGSKFYKEKQSREKDINIRSWRKLLLLCIVKIKPHLLLPTVWGIMGLLSFSSALWFYGRESKVTGVTDLSMPIIFTLSCMSLRDFWDCPLAFHFASANEPRLWSRMFSLFQNTSFEVSCQPHVYRIAGWLCAPEDR